MYSQSVHTVMLTTTERNFPTHIHTYVTISLKLRTVHRPSPVVLQTRPPPSENERRPSEELSWYRVSFVLRIASTSGRSNDTLSCDGRRRDVRRTSGVSWGWVGGVACNRFMSKDRFDLVQRTYEGWQRSERRSVTRGQETVARRCQVRSPSIPSNGASGTILKNVKRRLSLNPFTLPSRSSIIFKSIAHYHDNFCNNINKRERVVLQTTSCLTS